MVYLPLLFPLVWLALPVAGQNETLGTNHSCGDGIHDGGLQDWSNNETHGMYGDAMHGHHHSRRTHGGMYNNSSGGSSNGTQNGRHRWCGDGDGNSTQQQQQGQESLLRSHRGENAALLLFVAGAVALAILGACCCACVRSRTTTATGRGAPPPGKSLEQDWTVTPHNDYYGDIYTDQALRESDTSTAAGRAGHDVAGQVGEDNGKPTGSAENRVAHDVI
jgi:hypothetical protein